MSYFLFVATFVYVAQDVSSDKCFFNYPNKLTGLQQVTVQAQVKSQMADINVLRTKRGQER